MRLHRDISRADKYLNSHHFSDEILKNCEEKFPFKSCLPGVDLGFTSEKKKGQKKRGYISDFSSL